MELLVMLLISVEYMYTVVHIVLIIVFLEKLSIKNKSLSQSFHRCKIFIPPSWVTVCIHYRVSWLKELKIVCKAIDFSELWQFFALTSILHVIRCVTESWSAKCKYKHKSKQQTGSTRPFDSHELTRKLPARFTHELDWTLNWECMCSLWSLMQAIWTFAFSHEMLKKKYLQFQGGIWTCRKTASHQRTHSLWGKELHFLLDS